MTGIDSGCGTAVASDCRHKVGVAFAVDQTIDRAKASN
jgi:hypothetical protein